jgi:hypothetical protein
MRRKLRRGSSSVTLCLGVAFEVVEILLGDLSPLGDADLGVDIPRGLEATRCRLATTAGWVCCKVG